MGHSRWHLALIFSALLGAASTSGFAQAQYIALEYDPCEGTLPGAQGWTRAGSSGGESLDSCSMTLVSDVVPLRYYSTAPLDTCWRDGGVVEAEIEVTSSGFQYFKPGNVRTGFYIIAGRDANQEVWQVGVSSDRIHLATDGAGATDSTGAEYTEHLVDMTDGVKSIRLETNQDGGRLFLDGVEVLSLPHGPQKSASPEYWWGDGSQYAGCNVTVYSHTLSVGTQECLADVNGDGTLAATDFTAWINAFNNAEPACDQNNDGSCTPADFTAWIANFNAGCD